MLDEKHKKSSFLLEPFLLLAKTAKGAAAAYLVEQVTEAPGIFVFGELMHIDGIKELERSEHYSKQWRLLQIYAFGTYKDYKTNIVDLPSISAQQTRKLQMLTIASLASKSKYLSYKLLQESLDIEKVRDLEDLIIESIYAAIISGKINQKLQRLEVDFVIGRDIQPPMVDNIISTLESWCANCEKAMNNLEEQSTRANTLKEMKGLYRKQIESQVEDVRKAIKAQELQQEIDPDASSTQKQRPQKFKQHKSTMKQQPSRTR